MKTILVAGIGNVFFGDDGFGSEVVRRLAREPLPEGTTAVDYGIRGVHLAFELLSAPDLLIVVDAVSRGGVPGTIYLLEPDAGSANVAPDAHTMDLGVVFASLESMGGRLPRTRIVGCEPQDLSERMELSAPVEDAIAPALRAVRELIEREVSQ